MFESLRDAFRQAGENFRAELQRDSTPEAIDRLLLALRNELAALTQASHELRLELERVEVRVVEERAETETCLRRGRLAEEIGDAETAAVALEFADKHRRRSELLLDKAGTLERELEERRAMIEEVTDMHAAVRDRRESIVAAVGRARSRGRMRQARTLFDEMDRIAGKIERLDASSGDGFRPGEAADPGSGADSASGHEPRSPADEAQARLDELKRRLDRE